MSNVTLYDGCWGKTRDGHIEGPFKKMPYKFENNMEFSCFIEHCEETFRIDGTYQLDPTIESDLDIIEVYPSDPRITPTVEPQKQAESTQDTPSLPPPHSASQSASNGAGGSRGRH